MVTLADMARKNSKSIGELKVMCLVAHNDRARLTILSKNLLREMFIRILDKPPKRARSFKIHNL